jgi:hypothetical protein
MEATPPQEPIRSKPEKPVEPPVPKVRKSMKAAARTTEPAVQPAPDAAMPEIAEIDEIYIEQVATRVYGALALGVMAVLIVCIIAFLIAFRHAPQGL